jgi:hypothetical protein
MKKVQIVDLGRAVKVTRSSFIGNTPEVANPALRYGA